MKNKQTFNFVQFCLSLITFVLLFAACSLDEDIATMHESTRRYTVSFMSNGGSGVPAKTVNSGSTVSRPAEPSRIGYTFVGWYNDADFNAMYNFSAAIRANTTLYAKWDILTFLVTFDSADISSVKSQSINYGDSVIRPDDPAPIGHIFMGWYTDENKTNEYDFATPVTAGLVLYAKWRTVATHTVEFESNGGARVSTRTVNSGYTIDRPADPALYAFKIVNWYSDSDLTTVYDFSEPVTADVVLYAKWEWDGVSYYTVTFSTNTPHRLTPPDPQKVKPGNSIVLPRPSRYGYSNGGRKLSDYWSTNGSTGGTFYRGGSSFTPTGNITLYVDWTGYGLDPGAVTGPLYY